LANPGQDTKRGTTTRIPGHVENRKVTGKLNPKTENSRGKRALSSWGGKLGKVSKLRDKGTKIQNSNKKQPGDQPLVNGKEVDFRKEDLG